MLELILWCSACLHSQIRPPAVPATTSPSKAVELPFETSKDGGWLFVRVKIDGATRLLLLDTGSPGLVINAVPVESGRKSVVIRGLGGNANAQMARVNLQIGDTEFSIQAVHADLRSLQHATNVNLDGILGIQVLSQFRRATVDFQRHVLELEE